MSASRVLIEEIDEDEGIETETHTDVQKQQQQAATVATSHSPASVPSAPASSSPAATATDTWSSLLSALSLPSFFSTLSDPYSAATAAYASARELPSFYRRATEGLAQLQSTLNDVAAAVKRCEANADTIEKQTALKPLRQNIVQLTCSCMSYLLPPLPTRPLPHLQHDDNEQQQQQQQQLDKYEWITPALSAAAEKALTTIASLLSDSSAAAPTSSAADLIPSFLASIAPSHLLPSLRASMRSTSTLGTDWKSASNFPRPFLVCYLVSALPASSLQENSAHLLALILPLTDDHEPRFKVAGIAAMATMMRRAGALAFTEGKAEVVINSLKTCLSFRSPLILSHALLTCLLAYRILYPPLLQQQTADDVATMQAALEAAENAEVSSLRATATPTKRQRHESPFASDVSAAAATSSLALAARLQAQASMYTHMLRELTYAAISPSMENTATMEIYAAHLPQLLLYVGPVNILPRLQQLLPVLLQWCVDSTATANLRAGGGSVQRRLLAYGWATIELLLTMAVVGQRLAQQHGPRLIEACAQAWIQETRECSRDTDAKDKKSATFYRSDVSPTDPRFDAEYSSRPVILHVVQMLRALIPKTFAAIFDELRQMPLLASLAKLLDCAAA